MFRDISRRIALQFTGFVFLLLLVNGLLFLIADLSNEDRMARGRLVRNAEMVAREAEVAIGGGRAQLPKMLRESIRIVKEDGTPLHTGEFFMALPLPSHAGLETVFFEGDRYNVITLELKSPGRPKGFVQVAAPERLSMGDLPLRAGLYMIVSIAISVLIYAVGTFFAGRSLRPAAEAMQQLEQFTQDASHELRTPLTALSSSLDLALKSGKYKEGIESAKDDLHKTAELLERLLQIARLGTAGVERSPVDLSALVHQTVERFAPLAEERHVQVTMKVATGVRAVGDESLVRQVVQNLLQNAVKFSKPAGGAIAVTLTKDRFSIADDGVGIPAASLPHIFDRFYQADASRTHGGHGLGLSLVKRIVELHGWSIDAQSTEGKGATFTVRFA